MTDIEDYESFLIMEENTLLKVDRTRKVEIQVSRTSVHGSRVCIWGRLGALRECLAG